VLGLTFPNAPGIVGVEGFCMSEASAETTFDVAIVCALHEKELGKVKLVAPERWASFHVPKDPTTYEKTTYETKRGQRLRIVAAAAPQMGMAAASNLTTKMLMHFQPKLVVMVGIAAGVSAEKQAFGDILAPHTTFDYAAGKVTENKDTHALDFAPDPMPLPIKANLRDRLLQWQARREQLDAICDVFHGPKPRERLRLHTDALGSGPSVLGTALPMDEIRVHWRKLMGVEMEAHGVHQACHDADTPFLCLKSICDFASAKSDDWQDYAAFTAAQFCYRFLVEEWETLFPNPP